MRRSLRPADRRQRRRHPPRDALPAQPPAQHATACAGCASNARSPAPPPPTRARWSATLLRPRLPRRLDDHAAHPPHRLPARTRAWSIGENLAWGAGALATPGRIVNAWMRSPGHRRQHPRRPLPRDRHRRRARRAARRTAARRRRRPTRPSSASAPLSGVRARGSVLAFGRHGRRPTLPRAALRPRRRRPAAAVVAPPYDVIDPEQRAGARRRVRRTTSSPSTCRPAGRRPLRGGRAACSTLWKRRGRVVRDDAPGAVGAPAGLHRPRRRARTRRGFFARVRVEDYGPGRIRPHERTHPGPKEDRLRLTRATRANLSPIFRLYDDPAGRRVEGAGAAPRRRAVGRGDRRRRHAATGCGGSPTAPRSRPSGCAGATSSC